MGGSRCWWGKGDAIIGVDVGFVKGVGEIAMEDGV